MAIFNLRKREIQAKVVYYGPGLSGKTTNLQHVHNKLKSENKGELMTLATQTDRTLFFDFLPIELGEIRGLKTRFQLYTVPGQVFYNSTRKLVLKNADGVVFVADSRTEALNDNIESLRNLEQNLEAHRSTLDKIPLILQYNKRDMPTAMSIEDLNRHLNPNGLPVIEAQAHSGKGVLDTLGAICKAVVKDLRDKDPNNFRNPDDTGIHTRIASTPAAAQPPEPAKFDSASVDVESKPSQPIPKTSSPASAWKVNPSVNKPTLRDGLLLVPVSLTNGVDTVNLNLKVQLELFDVADSAT